MDHVKFLHPKLSCSICRSLCRTMLEQNFAVLCREIVSIQTALICALLNLLSLPLAKRRKKKSLNTLTYYLPCCNGSTIQTLNAYTEHVALKKAYAGRNIFSYNKSMLLCITDPNNLQTTNIHHAGKNK